MHSKLLDILWVLALPNIQSSSAKLNFNDAPPLFIIFDSHWNATNKFDFCSSKLHQTEYKPIEHSTLNTGKEKRIQSVQHYFSPSLRQKIHFAQMLLERPQAEQCSNLILDEIHLMGFHILFGRFPFNMIMKCWLLFCYPTAQEKHLKLEFPLIKP